MSYVAAAFIIALSCTVGAFGVYLTRRIFSSESLEKFNDVGGVVFLQVGVIYGVLLSFVAVLAWDQFAAASSAVELEAAELGTVYQLSKAIGSQRDQGCGSGIRFNWEERHDSIAGETDNFPTIGKYTFDQRIKDTMHQA